MPPWSRPCARRCATRRGKRDSRPRASSGSGWTRPDQARFPWTRATGRSVRCRAGAKTPTPSAGFGRTTRAGARRRASPRWRPSTARTSSPNAATRIPPNGSGAKSGAAKTLRRKFSTPLILGSSWPTGSRPFWPALPTLARSGAASARPGTKACSARSGAGCRTKNFSRCSIPDWPRCATGFTTRPTTPRKLPGTFARNGRRSSDCPQASPSPSANSTSIMAPSAAGSPRAFSSRSSAPRLAIARSFRVSARCATSRASAASCRGPSCRAFSASRRVSRPWAIFSNGGSRASAAATRPCTRALRAKRPRCARAKAACWRWTGTTATGRSWWTRCSADCSWARPCTRRGRKSTARSSRAPRSARAPSSSASKNTASPCGAWFAPAASPRKTRCSCKSTPT